MSKTVNTALKQRQNALLTPVQKKYREELILKEDMILKAQEEEAPRKMGRPRQATFPEAWKGFKDSPDYQRLYAAIQNREFVIEHLIWRAFNAGYKAK